MGIVDRQEFIKQAAFCGAAWAWGSIVAHASGVSWSERRDLFSEGVASGDPAPDSVLLWTRRPFDKVERQTLTVELAAVSPALRRQSFDGYLYNSGSRSIEEAKIRTACRSVAATAVPSKRTGVKKRGSGEPYLLIGSMKRVC